MSDVPVFRTPEETNDPEKINSAFDQLYNGLRKDPQNKIDDADGTLDDITSKFNTLLSYMKSLKFMSET